ncbi:MAG: low affinity iron permease family protein [Rhodanobacter sp.]
MKTFSKAFSRFAEATSRYAGKPVAFLAAVAIVVIWAASGPMFHYGETWQLVINTGTTIVTFLMVFLIQNSQNREGSALHIKLDELIRVTEAQNGLLNLEDLDDETLEKIRLHYRKLAERPASAAVNGKKPKVDEDFGEVDRAIRDAAADVAAAADAAKS